MRNSIILYTVSLSIALAFPATSQATTLGVYFDTGAQVDEIISVDGVAFDAYFILTTADIEFVWGVWFAYALRATAGDSAHFTRLAESLPPLDNRMVNIDSDDPWSGHYIFFLETPMPVIGGSAILLSWEVILSGDVEVYVWLGENTLTGPPIVVDELANEHFLSAASGAWDMSVAHITGVAGPTPVALSSFGQLKCIYR